MKAHNKHHASVLTPYFFVRSCLPMELHWNLKVCCLYFFFFFKIWASNLGVQLVYGCSLYMDFYGNARKDEMALNKPMRE